jgi:hypothetical protein
LRSPTLAKDEGAQSRFEFGLVRPLRLLMTTAPFDVAPAASQEHTLVRPRAKGRVMPSVTTPGMPPARTERSHVKPTPPRSSATRLFGMRQQRDHRVARRHKRPGDARVGRRRGAVRPLPLQDLLGGVFEINLRGGSVLVLQQ